MVNHVLNQANGKSCFKSSMLIFVYITKLNGVMKDLLDDCLTELPCTTMETPFWTPLTAFIVKEIM